LSEARSIQKPQRTGGGLSPLLFSEGLSYQERNGETAAGPDVLYEHAAAKGCRYVTSGSDVLT